MISKNEYASRRRELMRAVGKQGIIIVSAASEVIRNNDATYPFRQNSDFYYLTGFDEPQAVMVLAPGHADGEFILFNRERDQAREIWDGPRLGQRGACQHLGADASYPYSQFQSKLADLLADRDAVYYPIGCDKLLDELLPRALNDLRNGVRRGVKAPQQLNDVAPLIHEMRLFKSPAELKLMQKAVDISVQAHHDAMQACRVGMNECELDAVLSYEFKRRGAVSPAYTSIVAAGANACVLHYVRNDQHIKRDDLVLIDAGAEFANYAADITRTFPANGKFSAEQRQVYEIVLEAQQAGINAVKPGAPWNTIQNVILKVITQGLVDLGILRGKVSKLITERAFAPYYMHGSGHWLGLDVHDAGSYKVNNQWRKLQPNMVLTVEPGIYISPRDKKAHQRWRGIAVRIEDDVLVTKKGNRVLSAALVKTVDDIERWMGSE